MCQGMVRECIGVGALNIVSRHIVMKEYGLNSKEENRSAGWCVLRTMDNGQAFRTPLFFSDVEGCSMSRFMLKTNGKREKQR